MMHRAVFCLSGSCSGYSFHQPDLEGFQCNCDLQEALRILTVLDEQGRNGMETDKYK